jgi:hypothetical protein
MITPGTLFEEFGFNYIGPIDGHDLDALIPTLQNLRRAEGPAVPARHHAKGQGYKLAEADPDPVPRRRQVRCRQWHRAGQGPGKPTYTQVFGDWLCDMAKADPRWSASPRRCAKAPAWCASPGVPAALLRCRHRRAARGDLRRRPGLRRHAAGGGDLFDLPAARLRPADPRHRLQNLPVVFAIDRGGLVGADGATHNGAFDLSYLRCIPNMVVMTPATRTNAGKMLYTAFRHRRPQRRALPARQRPGRESNPGWEPCRSARAKCAAGQARRAAGLRQPCWRRRSRRPKRWMPRWPTCASSSPGCRTDPPTRRQPRPAGEHRGERLIGGAGRWRARWSQPGCTPLLRLACPTASSTTAIRSALLLAEAAWTRRHRRKRDRETWPRTANS